MRKITTGLLTSAVLLGIAISLVCVALGTGTWATIGIAIVGGTLPLWPIHHQTVGELLVAKRRYRHRPRGRNEIVDMNDTGVTYGNGEIGVVLEIDPAPFTVTILYEPSEEPVNDTESDPDAVEDDDLAGFLDGTTTNQSEIPGLDPDTIYGSSEPEDITDTGNDPVDETVAEDTEHLDDADDEPEPTADRPATMPTLPLSTIRGFLHRSGINAARIRIHTNGYLTADTSPAAEDYLNHIPLTSPPPINQATAIEVGVAMDKSLQAIYNRMLDDTPEAIAQASGRTAYVVAARILRSLSRHRIASHIATITQIRDYHDRVLDTLNESIAGETPTHGAGEVNQSVTYVPHRHDPEALHDVYAYGNTITSTWDLIGTPDSAVIDTAITVAAPTLDGARAPEFGAWYPPRYRQGNLQTRALPLAVTVEANAIPVHTLTDEYDASIAAHGSGPFLGTTPDNGALFLNATTGGRTMWMCAAPWHLSSLLYRLAQAGTSVNVTVPAAKPFVDVLNSPWISYDTDLDDTGGILIIDADTTRPPSPVPANTAVIAYSPRNRPEAAPYLLYPVTETDYVIRSMSNEKAFRWDLTHHEYDLLDQAQHLVDSSSI